MRIILVCVVRSSSCHFSSFSPLLCRLPWRQKRYGDVAMCVKRQKSVPFFCGSEFVRFGMDGDGCSRRVCGGGLCALRRNSVGTRAPRAVGGRVVDGIVIRGAGGSGSDFCLGGIGGGAPAKQRGTVAAAACRALEAVGSGAGASLESVACRDARLSNIGQWKCCTIGCTVNRKL